jgi:tetratricopeptide (TPR) repeat protein
MTSWDFSKFMKDQVARYAAEAERARECGCRTLQAEALQKLAQSQMLLGDFEASRRHLNDAIAIARAMGDARCEALALLSYGDHALLTGEDLELGLKRTRAALNHFEMLGDIEQVGATWLLIGRLLDADGAREGALDAWQHGLSAVEGRRFPSIEARLWCAKAKMHEELAETEAAREGYEQALRILPLTAWQERMLPNGMLLSLDVSEGKWLASARRAAEATVAVTRIVAMVGGRAAALRFMASMFTVMRPLLSRVGLVPDSGWAELTRQERSLLRALFPPIVFDFVRVFESGGKDLGARWRRRPRHYQ